MPYDKNITIAFRAFLLTSTLLLGASQVQASELSGAYVLGGKGTLLLTFDGAGNFTGTGAIPFYGIVNVQGTAAVDAKNKITGAFALIDQRTLSTIYSSSLSGTSKPGGTNITVRLNTRPAQSFQGGPRTGIEPVPGGQYFKTLLPNSLIFQFDRSGDRQTTTLQGDQDFALDLTQAVGGQILFNQSGNGYGVVYENGDPTNPPRWAAAHYDPRKDQLNLLLTTALIGGIKKTYIFLGAGSTGKYDGIYLATITADTCASIQVKITVKDGVVSGSDSTTGSISGTLDDAGNLSFTAQQLTVPAGCAESGPHPGTVTFTGTPTIGPVYPAILSGNFTGVGVTGTFTISQPSGVTGATTPGNLTRAETWSGTFTGLHKSMLCPGGVFGESFTISLSFPSSLIAALRGKTQIISGTGSVSGSETIQTQAPLSTAVCAIIANTDSASVNVTFVGIFNGTRPSIEFDSTTNPILLNSAQFFTGTNTGKTLSENRHIIKFRESFKNATRVEGGWEDGTWVLRKQ